MAAAACTETAPGTSTATRVAAPAPQDIGAVCSDIGSARVCWHDGTQTIVPRTVPSGSTPASGFRCGGVGSERVCEDRSRNASPFQCGTQRCLQTRPRLPDDGEWDCVEISGVVFCHSRGSVAGMEAGPMDLGWQCGARRGSSSGERICIDLDADRPSDPARQRCRYEPHFGAPQRSCTSAQTPLVGRACGPSRACPVGSDCSAGLCLPERPEPACWLDRDCGDGAQCVLGSCRGT
jgi:hypothetical protein